MADLEGLSPRVIRRLNFTVSSVPVTSVHLLYPAFSLSLSRRARWCWPAAWCPQAGDS